MTSQDLTPPSLPCPVTVSLYSRLRTWCYAVRGYLVILKYSSLLTLISRSACDMQTEQAIITYVFDIQSLLSRIVAQNVIVSEDTISPPPYSLRIPYYLFSCRVLSLTHIYRTHIISSKYISLVSSLFSLASGSEGDAERRGGGGFCKCIPHYLFSFPVSTAVSVFTRHSLPTGFPWTTYIRRSWLRQIW